MEGGLVVACFKLTPFYRLTAPAENIIAKIRRNFRDWRKQDEYRLSGEIREIKSNKVNKRWKEGGAVAYRAYYRQQHFYMATNEKVLVPMKVKITLQMHTQRNRHSGHASKKEKGRLEWLWNPKRLGYWRLYSMKWTHARSY